MQWKEKNFNQKTANPKNGSYIIETLCQLPTYELPYKSY